MTKRIQRKKKISKQSPLKMEEMEAQRASKREDYRRAMRALITGDRDVRHRLRELRAESREELVQRLQKLRISTRGEVPVLADRLVRFAYRLLGTVVEVPWYPDWDDNLDSADEEEMGPGLEASDLIEIEELSPPGANSSITSAVMGCATSFAVATSPNAPITTLASTLFHSGLVNMQARPIMSALTMPAQDSPGTTIILDQARQANIPTRFESQWPSIWLPAYGPDPRGVSGMNFPARERQELSIPAAPPATPNANQIRRPINPPAPFYDFMDHSQSLDTSGNVRERTEPPPVSMANEAVRIATTNVPTRITTSEAPATSRPADRVRNARTSATVEETVTSTCEEASSPSVRRVPKHKKKSQKSSKKQYFHGYSSVEETSESDEGAFCPVEDASEESPSGDSDSTEERQMRRATLKKGENRKSRGLSRRQLGNVRALQGWKITFAGKPKEDLEEYLEQLLDFQDTIGLSKDELWRAMPCSLRKEARSWYRGVRADVHSWDDFVRRFRHRYAKTLDRDEIWAELRAQTQGDGETITQYLARINIIIRRFKKKPSARRQLRVIYRNLRPVYRKYLREKTMYTLDDMDKYGRRLEKELEYDKRYVPPPPKDKCQIPQASFKSQKDSSRKAASRRKEESEDADTETESDSEYEEDTKRRRRRHKKKERQVAAVQETSPPSDRPKEETWAEIVKSRPANADAQEGNRKIGGRRAQANWSQRPTRGAGNTSVAVQEPQPSTSSASQPPRENRNAFVGVCFTCHTPGHRAAECPRRACYSCHQIGHNAAQCPNRKSFGRQQRGGVFCQVCNAQGVTFRTCRNCEHRRQQWENESAGGLHSPKSPAMNQGLSASQ